MTTFEAADKLSRKDIREVASKMSDDEARFLVRNYYIMQEDRKRYNNQIRSLEETENLLLKHLSSSATIAENNIKKAMEDYTDAHPVGAWLKSIYGIGPIIAAGLLAHIDITKAPTAGHIWSFAGLDPTKTWNKGEKRPFNPDLKKVCYFIGQSMMKFSGNDKCYYGKLYLERKEYEVKRNESGGNKELAATLITKYNKKTESYKHLLGGKLPPAQIDARARRWCVKIFLSHLQAHWFKVQYGVEAPKPFAIAILGHAHMIEPAN